MSVDPQVCTSVHPNIFTFVFPLSLVFYIVSAVCPPMLVPVIRASKKQQGALRARTHIKVIVHITTKAHQCWRRPNEHFSITLDTYPSLSLTTCPPHPSGVQSYSSHVDSLRDVGRAKCYACPMPLLVVPPRASAQVISHLLASAATTTRFKSACGAEPINGTRQLIHGAC